MKLQTLRPFELDDVAACIDMFLDLANQEAEMADPWTENAVAQRLAAILESPVFKGYVLEAEDEDKGFLLGVFSYWAGGTGFEILELVVKPGEDQRASAAAMLEGAAPLLKAKGVSRINALTSQWWGGDFFASCGFRENQGVRLFERRL